MNLKTVTPWNWFRNETESNPISPDSGFENNSGTNPITRIQHDMEQMVTDFMRGFGFPRLFEKHMASFDMGKPRIDITETNESYLIKAEIPGVDEKDIEITLHDNALSIKGQKKMESSSSSDTRHSTECFYGSFWRQLVLPNDANKDSIDARFDKGILSITITKDPSVQENERHIEVNKTQH